MGPLHSNARAVLVHLGDYIDRGPDSAGVVARLMAPLLMPPEVVAPEVVCLMGNHEDMLLGALEGRRGSAEIWLANGGVESLQSWGVGWRTPAKRWAGLLPAAQVEFLRGLPVLHRLGGYVFVHAGLRPGVAMEAQTRQDMLWIREPFLSSDADLGAVVVHGHTPEESLPVVRVNRIGMDTGAVLGGMLSCVVLEGETMGFLQV
jgi:serine/threonine protein phosphatase 1